MRFVHDREDRRDLFCEGEYQPLSEGLGWLRGVCERRGVPLIRRDTEAVMRKILQETRPERILEAGTALGYSACLMATAVPAARITTIEIDARSFCDAREAIGRLGLAGRIEQLQGDAAEVLPQLADQGRHYDLVFIDAAKSHYRTYFEASLKMMRPGGLILCDNLMLGASMESPADGDRRHRTSAKRMAAFLEELRSDARVVTDFYECGDGLSVSRILQTDNRE